MILLGNAVLALEADHLFEKVETDVSSADYRSDSLRFEPVIVKRGDTNRSRPLDHHMILASDLDDCVSYRLFADQNNSVNQFLNDG